MERITVTTLTAEKIAELPGKVNDQFTFSTFVPGTVRMDKPVVEEQPDGTYQVDYRFSQ